MDQIEKLVRTHTSQLESLNKQITQLENTLNNVIEHVKLVTHTLEVTKTVVTRLIINPESLNKLITADGKGLDISKLDEINREEYIAHPIYLEGLAAKAEGKLEIDNPYEKGSLEARRWNDGRTEAALH